MPIDHIFYLLKGDYKCQTLETQLLIPGGGNQGACCGRGMCGRRRRAEVAPGAQALEGSILFGDTMVPNIQYIISSFWGIVSYIGNIILMGLTTKKTLFLRV